MMKRMNLEKQNKIEPSKVGGSKLDQQTTKDMKFNELKNEIIIKKDTFDEYYLFLQDKKGEDVFIDGWVARLGVKKSTPIYDTLNSQIGAIQFNPSKKEFKIIITRYAGESEIYRMVDEEKGIAFGNKFGYWKVKGVWNKHLSYLWQTIYYQLRKDAEAEDDKKKLLGLYEWELSQEERYWKRNLIYITNPYHVADLKNWVKDLKGEIN